MFGYMASKIFGTRNDRVLKSLQPLAAQVNELEPTYQAMSDAELQAQTGHFKERLSQGASLDDIQAEAFAVVREAAVRTLGMRHFDVQIIGGAVLHSGKIAEMKTGEGKTLVATLAAYLNALPERGVHIVTVNDYLAKRDAEWMGKVYRFLGLSVGVIYPRQNEDEKRLAYRCDITYGQNNEFGFDYLRDNMKYTADELLQRGHAYAIVDEVDSILIDEARTPLIISGPAEDSTEQYLQINKIIPKLVKEEDYEIELKTKQPTLTEHGIASAEKLLNVENLYDPKHIETVHHINQALRAHTTLERDVDYVVKDGEVIIVDEFTGRLMPGRRWSNGLHQAVEAKEGVTVRRENQTLASITFQNLFRMYDKLAGMTGTAITEAPEFAEIYKLEVVVVPTNKPMIRDDQSDMVFRTREEKYEAVAEDIAEIHVAGQPILVGTISIEQSESLARELRKKGVPHNVLNAKHHEREAEIVAQAGRWGAVTISTNMAGRGTDIMLGGNPEFLAIAETGTKDENDAAYQQALERFQAVCAEEKKRVIEAGGLFILGTERHESRRIDNQLRGRAGRQGDPGTTRFYVSLSDDLMHRFGGDRIQNLMSKLGWEEGIAMDGRMITRSIQTAQERVERFHFDSRKHVTEYDDVMNKQRQVVYNLRAKILYGEDVRSEIRDMVDDLVEESILTACGDKSKSRAWDIEQLHARLEFLFRRPIEIPDEKAVDHQTLFDFIREHAWQEYIRRADILAEKLAKLEDLTSREQMPLILSLSRDPEKPFDFSTIEQNVLLERLDHFWNLHLQEMDHLREGVGLRGYGQLNPLHEYQKEGFELFQAMLANLKESVVRDLFYYDVPEPEVYLAHLEEEFRRREQMQRRLQMIHDGGEEDASDEASKDPSAQREKRAQQKRARRKSKR